MPSTSTLLNSARMAYMLYFDCMLARLFRNAWVHGKWWEGSRCGSELRWLGIG
jgi:hypothetical protein